MAGLLKISLKVLLPNNKTEYWSHFCYVDVALKTKFNAFTDTPMKDWVIRWSRKDFNMPDLDTTKDLDKLKSKIRHTYAQLFPTIYRQMETDRQGWVRIWLSDHIREELSK